MTTSPLRQTVATLCALAAVVAAAACSPGIGPGTGQVPGAGDPYYPDLGNPGYQAEHYDLELSVDPVRGTLAGTEQIRARSSQALSRFSLDLAGLTVQRVTVDGAPGPRPP